MIKDVKKLRLFLFDMDGTIYIGDRLFGFTKELLRTIRDVGGQYLFVTNNSSKSVGDYVQKLKSLGIDAEKADFMTASQATEFYLKKNHRGQNLYVVGTESLKKELRDSGFTVTDNTDETDCIIVGNDTELTFAKLYDVSKLLLTRKNIPYIATNPDYVCPTEFGGVPDCGSICEMLYRVSGRKPVVIGKPEALMIKLAMEKTGHTPEDTVVIGDRIYTDIKSGINAGVGTVLVMSGETTREILDGSEDKPDIVMEDAGELLRLLRA